MLTLWDLVKRVIHPARAPERGKGRAQEHRPPKAAVGGTGGTGDRPPGAAVRRTAEERYERVTREMLAKHGIRVRRWRRAMTGIAWEVRYRDGTVARLIEAPRPKGPMSAAVFLHEVGHHVIGFETYRPRCLEEYHAWAYSLATMEALGLNVTEGVRRRMHQSLKYAVDKARRRGLRALPPELEPFTRPWAGAGGRRVRRLAGARGSARPRG
ncbi:MAG: hypothetical protein WD749_10815 [Phycisphaerales bacterium]